MVLKYRSEIDGLRAIAVVSVVVFHFKFHVGGILLVPGGYLGVDVFFVISGFLITSIIASELEAKRFSLVDFYLRRARRILPALFLVVGTTVGGAWFLAYPGEFKRINEAALSALLFYSNHYALLNDPYFMESSESNPFLHTWSLSVEEQYYLVIPLLLIAAWKLRPTTRAFILVGISLASFLFAFWLAPIDSNTAFYLLPTRLWELMLGGVLAFSRSDVLLAVRGRARDLLVWSGLVGLLASFSFIDARAIHPSVVTLLPTISTGLILVFSEGSECSTQVLRYKIFNAVGKMSYSLYLWHVPALVLLPMIVDSISVWSKIGLLTVTALLAGFSYRFIEVPFRTARVRPKWLIASFGIFVVFAAVFSLSAQQNGAIQRFDDRFQNYESAVFDNKLLQLLSWKAVREEGQRFSSDSRTKVLFIGDSHSKDLFNAFYLNQEILPNLEFRRFGRDTRSDINFSSTCESLSIFKKSHQFQRADIVVIDSSQILIGKNRTQCLEEFLREIGDNQKSAVLASRHISFAEVPKPENWPSGRIHAPTLLDVHLFAQEKLFPTGQELVELEKAQFSLGDESTWKASAQMYNEFAEKNGIQFLDVTAMQCNSGSQRCSVVDDKGKKIYFDSHHWTQEGAKFLGRKLIRTYPALFTG